MRTCVWRPNGSRLLRWCFCVESRRIDLSPGFIRVSDVERLIARILKDAGSIRSPNGILYSLEISCWEIAIISFHGHAILHRAIDTRASFISLHQSGRIAVSSVCDYFPSRSVSTLVDHLDISIRVYTSPAIRLIKRRGAHKFLRSVVQHRETLFPFYVPSVSRYPTTCAPHARG